MDREKTSGTVRLVTLIVVLCSFIIAVGAFGYFNLTKLNETSKVNYTSRIVPIDQLTTIKQVYLRGIVKSTQAFAAGKQSKEACLQEIKDATTTLNQTWTTYKKSVNPPVSRQSVHKIDDLMSDVGKSIEQLKRLVQTNDKAAVSAFVSPRLVTEIEDVVAQLNHLLTIYFDSMDRAYTQSQTDFQNLKFQFQLTLFSVIVVALLLSILVIRAINKLIRALKSSHLETYKSDTRFRSFIQNAGDPILIFDNNLRVVELNDAVEVLLGYTKTELLGKKANEYIVDYFDFSEEEHIQLIRSKKSAIVERKLKKKDGTFALVEVNSTEQPGEGFIVIIRDISERKNTEKALQESDEKYRYLFKNSPAYNIIWELETFQIKEVNQAVLERYGYSEEEWKHMNAFQYRPAEDHEKIRNFANEMLQSDLKIIQNTWRHLTKQGDEIWMEITSHKIIYEGRPAILSLANDVTHQRKAAFELQEKKEQLKLFIDHSPAALAMLDTNMCYLETSKRWITDYGLHGQQIIGKSHYEIFPEILPRWKAIHQSALSGNLEKSDEDYFIRKDGKKEWIKWQIYPWHKATGEIGGIVMMTEVLTERKSAQELFQYQFENSPDIILIVNRLYRIEKINRSVEGGPSAEDLVGRDSIEVLPEQTRAMAMDALEKCFKTGENIEFEHLLRPGMYVRSRFAPIINEEHVTHVMIFATDITDMRKTNLELQQNEYKLRMLTEQISDAIILLNERAEIVYITSIVTKVTGFESTDLLHKHVTHFIVSEDLAAGQKVIEQSLSLPGVSLSFQFRIRDVHGNIFAIRGDAVNQLNDPNVKAFIVNFRVV